MIDRVKWDKAFGCDHSGQSEVLRVCIECKCAGCGQIKFRKTLEECYCGYDKIDLNPSAANNK